MGRIAKVAVVVVHVVIEAVARQNDGPRDPLERQYAEPRSPPNPVKGGQNRDVLVVMTRN